VPFADENRYIELVFSFKRIIEEHDILLTSLLVDRLSENGRFFLITSQKGDILFTNPAKMYVLGSKIFDFGMTKDLWSAPQFTPFLLKMNSEWNYCMYRELKNGERIFEFLPLSTNTVSNLLLAAVSDLALLLFLYVVQIIMQHSQKIQARVNKLVEEKMERHQEEIKLARDIQRNEMRRDVSDTFYSLIHSYIKPEEEVGGDFYDYYATPDGRFICLIADVSGHGIASAFFMMKTKITLREKILSSSSLVVICHPASVSSSMHSSALAPPSTPAAIALAMAFASCASAMVFF